MGRFVGHPVPGPGCAALTETGFSQSQKQGDQKLLMNDAWYQNIQIVLQYYIAGQGNHWHPLPPAWPPSVPPAS